MSAFSSFEKWELCAQPRRRGTEKGTNKTELRQAAVSTALPGAGAGPAVARGGSAPPSLSYPGSALGAARCPLVGFSGKGISARQASSPRAPGAPYPQSQCARPVTERPGTHLPAQQRQDEALELAQALVDARAAALLQQWLQALQAGAKAAVTRVAVQAPAPAALRPAARPRLLPCAAPPGPLPYEAAPCSAGKRRRCRARAWETCARPDTERRLRPAERCGARPERTPVERATPAARL